MKFIVDILKQFTQGQRVLVLVLLLVTVLLMSYFRQDDCSIVVKENLKMHEDFIKISQMLREERMRGLQVLDTVSIETNIPQQNTVDVNYMDEIQKIVDSNNK